MKNIRIALLPVVLLLLSQCAPPVRIYEARLNYSANPWTINNSTTIRAKKIELGVRQGATPTAMIVNLTDGSHLVIQCKRLRLRQDVQFNVASGDANVTIEYRRFAGSRRYEANSNLGADGSFKFSQKPF